MDSQLEPGERLLWSGQPKGGFRFSKQDIFMVPFSIVWAGFSIFWVVGASFAVTRGGDGHQNPGPIWLFPLFGLPFVAFGLYMLLGRFFVDRKQRQKTLYGITDQRIIIVSGIFSRTVTSLTLKGLSELSLSEKSDGFGTIQIGPPNPFSQMFPGFGWWPGMPATNSTALEMIPDARTVYALLRKASAAA